MLRKIVCLATAAAALVVMTQAQAGKTVTSRSGNCQVTVPASWTVDSTFGSANSPDKKVSLVVSSPKAYKSIDEVKQSAPTVYTEDKITKSTGSEFEMEGMSISNKPNVYRGIQATGAVCLVEVIYQSGTVEEARKIAETLKAVK